MHIYLPIAEASVNVLLIVGIGGLVGFLSGMFGVGGGFLITPALIFYGIPPSVAVASSTAQVAGASVSGMLAHWRRGGVDPKIGAFLVAGGLCGSVAGSFLFKFLQAVGQVDLVISLGYVVLLGSVGTLMLIESFRSLRQSVTGKPRPRARRHSRLVAGLPYKMRFHASGVYLSPIAPFLVGLGIGVLTVIMGVGGGFLLVPAMLYLLGMSASVVFGTSLFQTIFTTASATLLHAVNTQSVDIVLAVLLLVGGVVGAQVGARTAQRLPADRLRFLLSLIVLAVAIRVGIGLTWRPEEIFTVAATP